jgi:predicted metal-binding membrane protein
MTELAKGIRLLRSFTNHPARLIWTMIVLAATVALWSLHIAGGGGPGRWIALLDQLCRIGEPQRNVAGFAAAFSLWATMSLAMMLPSALPMISAYLDISDAARCGNKTVVPAGYLVAGYLAVWLIFAAAAAVLQTMVELTPAMALANGEHAALLLLLAGLYQFAPLKHACLSKCRAPMPYFLAHWSDRAPHMFGMGVEQGALCLACCWALMLLMFVAGLMNVMWMAALAVLVALEKTLPAPQALVYGSGAGLAAAGLLALVGS